MASTLLADLVRKQTAYGVIGVFDRVVAKVAEDLATDLLRDPALRDQLQALVKVAFESALKELQAAAPVDPRAKSRAALDEMLEANRQVLERSDKKNQ